MTKDYILDKRKGSRKNSILANLSIKSKLQSLIFAVSLASILTVGWIAWTQGRDNIKKQIFKQLTSVRSSKVGELELYFEDLLSKVILLTEDRNIIEAMVNFNRGFRKLESIFVSPEWKKSLTTYYQDEYFPILSQHLAEKEELTFSNYRPQSQAGSYLQYYYIADNPNPLGEKEKLFDAGDSSEYTEAHATYQPRLNQVIKQFGFYDLLLINYKTKNIVYSVAKETDYGSNIQQGIYAQSGLVEAVEKVLKNPTPGKAEISDFQAYRPSYEEPIAFIAAPIYSGENLLGILAIQISADKINQIVSGNNNWEDIGLGKTGEDYLVGQDNLMRSRSRFWQEDKEQYQANMRKQGVSKKTLNLMQVSDSTVGLQEIKTPTVESALGGKQGLDIASNYQGKEVLVSYSPLDIQGLRWAILSEIETEEAFAPLRRLQNTLLITGVIFLLLSLLLSEMASRLFLQPLRRLISQAKKIETGEIDAEITIDSEKEFGELAKTFNRVTHNLFQSNQELAAKNQENKYLLQNILPPAIAERKIQGESLIADKLKKVTIVYAHIVGVSSLEQWMSTEQITNLLTELVDEFDTIAENYGMERQKAPGTDYMVVCGLTQAILDQAKRAVDFSQAILKIVKDKEAEHKSVLGLNIGIHAGGVTAGVLGTNNFSYNLWGKTVDLATQLYPHTAKNQILLTRPIYERIVDDYSFIPHPIEIDNFKEVETWTLLNIQKMEVSQVELVQSSFAKVVPISDQAGELFYTHLFEVAPSFRPLFKNDMTTQRRKLMSTLAIAVEGLGNPEAIIPTVQKLGRSHAGYGVKAKYYETVGETLLWTLEQGLGKDFTPSVRAAWAEAYRFLSEIMKEATAEVKLDDAQELKITSNNN